MKFISFLALSCLALSISNKTHAEVVFGDSEIGDITYSYLDDSDFIKKHSDDWMKLTSNTNITGTELCTFMKLSNPNFNCKLPNFEGTFFRVASPKYPVGIRNEYKTGEPKARHEKDEKNEEIKPKDGLVFTCSTSPERLIGNLVGQGLPTKSPCGSGGYAFSYGDITLPKHTHDIGVDSKTSWNSETSPLNIPLHAYIRVNSKHTLKKMIDELRAEIETLK